MYTRVHVNGLPIQLPRGIYIIICSSEVRYLSIIIYFAHGSPVTGRTHTIIIIIITILYYLILSRYIINRRVCKPDRVPRTHAHALSSVMGTYIPTDYYYYYYNVRVFLYIIITACARSYTCVQLGAAIPGNVWGVFASADREKTSRFYYTTTRCTCPIPPYNICQ